MKAVDLAEAAFANTSDEKSLKFFIEFSKLRMKLPNTEAGLVWFGVQLSGLLVKAQDHLERALRDEHDRSLRAQMVAGCTKLENASAYLKSASKTAV